jgi:hypothetical protein
LQQGTRLGDLCQAGCSCAVRRGAAAPAWAIAVFEPWPSDAPPTWREAYLAAYAILESDVAQAAVLLQKLMAERPADLAVRRLAERLSPIRKSDRSPT